METVQQNGRFTFFSSKFPSNIYSTLFDLTTNRLVINKREDCKATVHVVFKPTLTNLTGSLSNII